ncbi:MAG: serine/threonine protein kinase with sensor(s) [Acidimicrobiales bacterium]|nr:serine/threonine protein kinase with sensor(s) [Acidimicrobiales bacterium]
MADQETRVYNGRYELHRRIARGGMADVYLARDLLLDRPVALKILFPEFSTDEAFVERFRREAQSAANLSHPNIVSVYDWGEEDGTYFIVMEYVEGRSLAQILRDEGALLPDRAADITTDIAAALGFAHRNGVIHRDVKPGNVLMSPLGQVKVTDFGIARAVSTQDNLTQTGTVMGTATYFSPEQARGESVDPRSDVYSLGVVLYELLTGEPPFTGDNPVSVAYKHVQEQAERPTHRNPRIPVALEAVVMKALAKNPANRYASADDLAADLRRYRDGRPVLAEGILPDEELTSAVSAATVASAYAGGATMAVPRTDGTRAVPVGAQEEWHEEPPKRSPTFLIVLGVLLVLLVALLVLFARNLGVGNSTAQVAVPTVVGLTQDQATTKLQDAGFTVDPKSESQPDKAPDIVLRQDPEAGTKIKKGDKVTIVVNSGQPSVSVPDLVGKTRPEADKLLSDAGLVGDFQPQADDTVPEGGVISQNPSSGDLPKGSTVTVTYSSGAGETQVPDVTGLTATDAANQLGRAGFQVVTADEASSTVEKGLVIRTNPAADATLQKGEKVTVFVSSGPSTSTVPSVIDLSPEQAVATLRADGFVVQQQTRTTLDPNEDGLVIGQSPEGDSQASAGSTVTIYIGRFVGSSSTTSSTTPTSTP